MAIEASVINEMDIKRLLLEKYSIKKINSITNINGGISNCRLINCERGKFVLKELPSSFSFNNVAVEPELTAFLGARDLPVARFVSSEDSAYIWVYNGRVFHLQEFIEGVIFDRNTAPDWFLLESPVLLGKINNELEKFPRLTDGMGKEYFASWPLQNAQRDFADLIHMVENDDKLDGKDEILEDLHYKQSKLAEVYKIDIDLNKTTFKNTHGDYKIYNLICGKSSVAAIIDFSSACVHPIVWEIICSYVHADPDCLNGDLNINNLCKYTVSYLKFGRLNTYDLRIMPYLFYYQQVRANYYNEYYYGHDTHKKGAFDVARWSTNICRWLDKYKDELSDSLITFCGRECAKIFN